MLQPSDGDRSSGTTRPATDSDRRFSAISRAFDLAVAHPHAPHVLIWTERGTALRQVLGEWLRRMFGQHGYRDVGSQMVREDILSASIGNPIWESWPEPIDAPSPFLLFASKARSHRELPVRYFAPDALLRSDWTSTGFDIGRRRGPPLDDSHVILAEEQMHDEPHRLAALARELYGALGLSYRARFVGRAPRGGTTSTRWQRAHAMLRAAFEGSGDSAPSAPRDAIESNPSIEFDVVDATGRCRPLGRIGLDATAPERLGLAYRGKDNCEHRPVVISHSMLGPIERCMALLIEHFDGAFPLWLSPEQVRVLPVAETFAAYAADVVSRLTIAHVRAALDTRQESLAGRIRRAELQKVPYMVVVGQREAATGTLTIRRRGDGDASRIMGCDDFVAMLARADETHTLP